MKLELYISENAQKVIKFDCWTIYFTKLPIPFSFSTTFLSNSHTNFVNKVIRSLKIGEIGPQKS